MKNLDKYLSLLEGEVDGLLLTSRYSRHYGAEFDIAEGAAIVTAKGCRYFTDSRYIESAENNLKGFEVKMVDRNNSYFKLLNEAIADFGVAVLGYEENYLTVAELMGYEKNLTAQLVPFNKQINGFRGVKEEWELELHAELIYCMYKNGAHALTFDPIVVSGPNTSLPHGVAGERIIQAGDFVTMDFGVLYYGYCSDMTRTVAVGYATEEMKRVYDTVLQAQLAGIAVTKAGVPGKDIDAAARKVIEDAGYGAYFGHGYGHSLGLEIHESPNPNPGNPDPMPENAVASAEPGIYLPGKFGVRIEDVTIFKADGCENITHSPKNLIII